MDHISVKYIHKINLPNNQNSNTEILTAWLMGSRISSNSGVESKSLKSRLHNLP